jgi:hypothetical protein
METSMPIRLAIISIAGLAAAAAAAPEPAKPAAGQPQQDHQPPTILASADHVRVPSQPAEAPRKPRAMRVTTCRCGDQAAEAAEEPKDR